MMIAQAYKNRETGALPEKKRIDLLEKMKGGEK
jgi:hypothetical protein